MRRVCYHNFRSERAHTDLRIDETRVQGWWKAAQPKKPKKRKCAHSDYREYNGKLTGSIIAVRLRRDPETGWDRRGKNKSKSREVSQISIESDAPEDNREDSPPADTKRRRLVSKPPTIKKESPTIMYVIIHTVLYASRRTGFYLATSVAHWTDYKARLLIISIDSMLT